MLNYDYPLKENVWQRVPVNESKYNDQLCFDAEANQFRAPSAGTYFFSANVFLNNTDAVEQSCQIRFDCPLEGERASSLRVLPDLKSHSSSTLSTKASRLWKKVIPSRFRRNARKQAQLCLLAQLGSWALKSDKPAELSFSFGPTRLYFNKIFFVLIR